MLDEATSSIGINCMLQQSSGWPLKNANRQRVGQVKTEKEKGRERERGRGSTKQRNEKRRNWVELRRAKARRDVGWGGKGREVESTHQPESHFILFPFPAVVARRWLSSCCSYSLLLPLLLLLLSSCRVCNVFPLATKCGKAERSKA